MEIDSSKGFVIHFNHHNSSLSLYTYCIDEKTKVQWD